MKATRYFATYLDAYNYYPNGVPSTEIAIVGDSSYILVSSDNAVVGTQAFYDAGMTNDQIVNTMVDTAYTNGYDNGYSYGYPIGYTAGTSYGYEQGYSYGYSYGYSEGEASSSTSLLDLSLEKQPFSIENVGSYGFTTTIAQNSGTVKIETYDKSTRQIVSNKSGEFSWNTVTLTLASGEVSFIYADNKISHVGFTPVSSGDPVDVKLSGNVLSLQHLQDFDGHRQQQAAFPSSGNWNSFKGIFSPSNNDTGNIDASDLVMPEYVATRGFRGFFAESGLTKAPKIVLFDPSIDEYGDNIGTNAYAEMFRGCTALVDSPVIQGEFRDNNFALSSMFKNCTALKMTPMLDAFGTNYSFTDVFGGCTGIQFIPYISFTCDFDNAFSPDVVIKKNTASISGVPATCTIYDYNPTTQSSLWSDDPEEFMLNVMSYSILNS